MTKRKHHIPHKDHYTHVSTLCGAFRSTLTECYGGPEICAKCIKEFTITKEQNQKEIEDLIAWGERFRLESLT